MSVKSRTEYSVLNIITGIGGYILNTILGFICRIVFVKCLSADYLGVNGLFSNILTMLSLAELGVGSAVVYALYKPLAVNDQKKIATLVKLYGTAYKYIGIVVFIVGICLLPVLNMIITTTPNISESLYLLYLINLFNTASTYFFSYRTSLIIAAQKNYIVSGLNYIITIVQSVVQIIVLLLTHNYLMYLLIQTLGTFTYNVLTSKIALKMFPYVAEKDTAELPKNEKQDLFKNVRDLLIYKISGLLVNNTDNILITFFNGLTITGIASNYTLFVSTLNSLLNQIFNGLTASIGNHNAIESVEKRYELFSFLNFMNFWIYGWGALGIVFCSSDLVELCFGIDYTLGIEIPIIMAINFYTVGMLNAVWTYKHTMGLFRYGRFLQLGTGIINLFFSVILGKVWGIFGILFATLISRLCTSIWYDPYVVFRYGFNKNPFDYLKKYFYYLGVLTIVTLVCKNVLDLFNFSIVVRVLFKIVICSLIVNIMFYAIFKNTKEFSKLRDIIYRLLAIIKRKEGK